MKTYGYLPIVMRKDLPELSGNSFAHEIRHLKREKDATTEMVAKLAMIKNDDIRKILAEYDAKLVEEENGSRTLGVTFPQKRFY